jgi:hypothetical protein
MPKQTPVILWLWQPDPQSLDAPAPLPEKRLPTQGCDDFNADCRLGLAFVLWFDIMPDIKPAE